MKNKKKISLESIGLSKVDQKNKKIDFDDVNFSLSQNNILAVINKNQDIQKKLFKIFSSKKITANDYQGFLIYSNKLAHAKTHYLNHDTSNYTNDTNYAFKQKLTFDDKNIRLREYLKRKFDQTIAINTNITKEFKKDRNQIINEYRYVFNEFKKASYYQYLLQQNERIEKFLINYDSLKNSYQGIENYLQQVNYYDEFLDLANRLYTQMIYDMQVFEQRAIEKYSKYQSMFRDNILFLNRQEIINLEKENKVFFKNIKKQSYATVSDNLKNELLKTRQEQKELKNHNIFLIKKTLRDLKIRKQTYKRKLYISKNNEEIIFFTKKYVASKNLHSSILKSFRYLKYLSPKLIKDFVSEIKTFMDYFESFTVIIKKNATKKQIIHQVKHTAYGKVGLLLDKYYNDAKQTKLKFRKTLNNLIKQYFKIQIKMRRQGQFVLSNEDKMTLKKNEYTLNEMKLNYEWNYEHYTRKVNEQLKTLKTNISTQQSRLNSNFNVLNDLIIRFDDVYTKFVNSSIKEKGPDNVFIKNLVSKYRYIYRQKEAFREYDSSLNNIYGVLEEKLPSEDHIYSFLFKRYVYNIFKEHKIDIKNLEKKVLNIDNNILLNIELSNLFISKPKVLIIGMGINSLILQDKKYILSRINQYVFDNNAIGIYFLDDLKLASEYSTDVIIFDNDEIIEKGKTASVCSNPIHPATKQFLGEDVSTAVLHEYFLRGDKFTTKQFYLIEDNHEIKCNWVELISWVDRSKVKNAELAKVLFYDLDTRKQNTEIVDKFNINDITIADFSEPAMQERANMDKNFNHKIIEKGRYDKWLKSKVFETHDQAKRPFTIILPPPNVTGMLHIGHALDTYIQDTVIRFKKLQGYDTLFLPAKDHAGIATQSKVEKMLQEQGISKHDIGREKFLKECWNWKEKYAQKIDSQWKTLGLALDYSHERFTLDKEANEAVLKVFVDLYNKKIIYRGTKPIYWDPVQQTALSNIEVLTEPTEQNMYYIKYPFKDSVNEYLEIATTRIETLPSDVAVAFNPDDKRYTKYLHKTLIHPLTGKEIPVISDSYIDPAFGSGLMKVSAHATEDIEIIKKNHLQINECINKDGLLNEVAGEFEGLDRFEARKKIAAKLQEEGYLIKTERTISNVGISERSGAVVEILVQPQWFMKMDKMSKMILHNLKTKHHVEFIPPRFEETIKSWMEKAYDWTISRQLWWGHRIPAYYKDDKVVVSLVSPGKDWVQDPDVLDTWFSSGLSPFVFLGWPKQNADLNHYFPTSLLVTGYDIIFFWVARMYFMSLEFTKQIPFKQVLIHGLVRDEQGRKMSKSLGNGIDPIQVIDQYGSDVLRISLLFNLTAGQDLNFSTQKLESSKLFVNKFWNIARYVNSLEYDENTEETKLDSYDVWIINKLKEFEKQLTINMDKYEFSVVYKVIQKFIVNEFSAWYLEFAKFKTKSKLIHRLFKKILLLMHPFLPFTTDYLYEKMYSENLLEASEPIIKSTTKNPKADYVIEIISELRKYRESKNISKSKVLYYQTDYSKLTKNDKLIIKKLSNFEYKENTDTLIQCSSFTIHILMDQETKDLEIKRLKKLLKDNEVDIDFVSKMLNNPKFVERAKPEKVAAEKEKLALYEAKKASYTEELAKLDSKNTK